MDWPWWVLLGIGVALGAIAIWWWLQRRRLEAGHELVSDASGIPRPVRSTAIPVLPTTDVPAPVAVATEIKEPPAPAATLPEEPPAPAATLPEEPPAPAPATDEDTPAIDDDTRTSKPARDEDHPYGPGSASPAPDGSGPEGWTVKGNTDSGLFHTPSSPAFKRTRAKVWFESEEAAQAAGFLRWDQRRRRP